MYLLRSSTRNLLRHSYCLGHYRINQRSFHQSTTLLKDEKTKELLKNLGLNLQKGTINRSNKTKDNKTNSSSIKDEKINDTENEKDESITRITENDNEEDKTDNQLVTTTTTTTTTDIPPDQQEVELKSTIPNDANTKTNSHGNNGQTDSNGVNNNNKKKNSEPIKNKKLGKNKPTTTTTNDENIIHEQLKNAFVTVALMTNKEFLEQIALDGRNFPFKHFKSEYLIDRQEILRQIPDMINIFNMKDMEKVEEIYQQLSQLDNDKSMHLQFLKQSFIDYKNDLLYLDQFLRGINLKFKQYRRGEVRYFFVYPTVFEHVHDKILHQYNVVGYDRSLFGMPLHQQQQKNKDRLVLPREFIQDLPQFDNIIELNKIDAALGFKLVEEKQSGKLVDSLWDPRMVKPLKELQKEYQERFNEQKKNQTLKQQKQQPLKSKGKFDGKTPKKYIVIKKGGYRQIKLKETSLQYSPVIRRIEEEIEMMINDLNKQIKTTLESDNIKVLIPNDNDKQMVSNFASSPSKIKTNHHEIVFKEKMYQGYIVSVERIILKNFNILPNYAVFYHGTNYPPIIKRKLLNHIFKIFLININEKFDYLQKIKYLTQRQQLEFQRKLIKQIKYIIKFKLSRYFDNNTLNQTTNSLRLNNWNVFNHEENNSYDNNNQSNEGKSCRDNANNDDDGVHAVIFNPYTDNCFKRIYWISSPFPSSIMKRQNMNLKRKFTKIKFKTIDERYITTTIA